MLNNRSFMVDGNLYDYVPAEVMYVNYKGDSDFELYNINVRLLYEVGSSSTGTIISAKPFDVSMKKIPAVGEIVHIIRGIDGNSNSGLYSTNNYYLNPISVYGNVNLNSMRSISSIQIQSDNSSETNTQESEVGYTDKKQFSDIFEYNSSFVSNIAMSFLQPYEADVIFEGRSGTSIRFSSTTKHNDLYSIPQNFGKGISKNGHPILIIRNGELTKQPNNRFSVENIDDPISTIWMTQGQSLQFTNPSTILDVQSRLETNSYDIEENKNSGNQIGIFSDRVFIVSKQKEVNILSKNGINLTTDSSIAIESQNFVEINSTRINLGIDAEQPVLLGNDTVDLLSNLITELKSICTNISSLTVGTGTGPSTPPINSSAFSLNKSNLESINSKLETLKSELVFLNKN